MIGQSGLADFRVHRRLLIGSILALVPGLPLAALWYLMLVFASDGGVKPESEIFFFLGTTLPLVLIAAPAAAWTAYALKRPVLAQGLMLTPVFWALASLTFIFVF